MHIYTHQRDTKKIWELLNTSITLSDDGITVFAYVQTHQIVHIKHMQFFVYQLYINKSIKKTDLVFFLHKQRT